MLSIKVPEERDKKGILDILNEEGFQYINLDDEILHNSMVVSDGGEIIGYSSYIPAPKEDVAAIDKLIIKKEYRGHHIGDGLIKSLLNLADKRQIKRVYIEARDENAGFLKKVGLTKRKLKASEEIAKYIVDELKDKDHIEVFEAILPDFFNKACKSKN